MPDGTNTGIIHPDALKAARKRQQMNQQDLADKIGCTKDTVSRWERGTSRRVRYHLRQPLCDALRVPWTKLTKQPEQNSGNPKDSLGRSTWIKTPVRKETRTSLQLVARTV